MTGSTIVRGGTVLRRRGQDYVTAPADVVIDGSTIRSVTPRQATGAREPAENMGAHDRVIEAAGKLVLPGLVNAHSHSSGNLARGLFDGLPLEPWIPYSAAVTLRRTWRDGYLSALLGCIEFVRTGTTAVLDQLGGTPESHAGAMQAYRDVGFRVALAPMVADVAPHETVATSIDLPADVRGRLGVQPVPPREAIVEQLEAALQTWHDPGGLSSVILGPSAPQRCSDELLIACRDLAQAWGTGIHTHLLETRAQQHFAHDRYGRSVVRYLSDLGVLSGRFTAAHAVWCTPDDLERLAAADAMLVHNPWSNLTLGSGVAPLAAWRSAGVTTALGTDGANCGGNQSLFRAMNLAAALHRGSDRPVEEWTTPAEVLRFATEGSARVLGADGVIGRIEPGYQADLVIVDVTSPTYVPAGAIVGQLVLGETGSGVETVLIAGEVVLQDRRLVGVDEHAVVDEARDVVEAMLGRNGDLLEAAELQRSWLLDVSRAPAGERGRG